MAPKSLMAGAAQPAAPAQPPSPAPAASRPLVLIIVDALRSDRMGVFEPSLGNTPFLSGLHASGQLRKFSAYSTCTFSFCGIMSIFASRSWNDFGRRPETIIDLLGRNSYDSHLLLAGQHADFGSMLRLLGGGIDTLKDQPPSTQPDDRWLLAELQRLELPKPRQSFLYLHMMSAHAGAHFEPRFRVTPGDDGRIGASLFSRGAKAAYRETYDRRVRQTDDVLKRIFAALERKGVLKDALVVITSDHGERIAEGGMLYHGGDADPPTLAIPLLIYDSRASAYPQRELASQIDVAPTLAAAIGLAPSPGWKGAPLQQQIARSAVPVGTWESTGAVIRHGSTPLLYLCNRSTGAESVVPFSGRAPPADTGLLASYRHLHRLVAAPVRDRPCLN